MIKPVLESICSILQILLATLVGLLIIPVAMQVIARYTGIIPVYLWTDELATFIFIWIVMIGSALAVWNDEHFDVKVLKDSSNATIAFFQKAIVHLCIVCFSIVFIWYGIDYVSFGYIQHSVMMNLNLSVIHLSVPLIGLLWLIFSLYRLYEAFQHYQLNQKVSK